MEVKQQKEQENDPGFGTKYNRRTKRLINKDGSFNIKIVGGPFSSSDVYQYLIGVSWSYFLLLVTAAFILVNVFFAALYLLAGVENLTGVEDKEGLKAFFHAFYFSAQTYTTVGYGGISPSGFATNFIASIEALFGWLGFALATGLMYGRFARPTASIAFSNKAIVAPYKDGRSLQFRIANKRHSILMDMEANAMLSIIETDAEGNPAKRYFDLRLEPEKILLFPLSWTVVHPIDEESPLHGKTAQDLERMLAEVLILIKGFDDTFKQTVHVRHSYYHDEIEWGAKFIKAFYAEEEGDIVLELHKINDYKSVELSLQDNSSDNSYPH